jgi:putative tricarboxylic transport membrane protein
MWTRRRKGEFILPLIFIGLGVTWIAVGARMPVWDGFAPDSGFLPLIYGVLLVGLSIAFLAELFAGRHAETEAETSRKPLTILAILTATVIGIDVIGFAAAIFLMLLALFAAVERHPVLVSFGVASAVTGALVLVFKTWLGIPLPLGPMGI